MSHLSLFLMTAVSLHIPSFLAGCMPCDFLFSKLDRLLSVIGTEGNRPLMSGFILIWLGAGLCLIFVVATVIRAFKFL